MNPESLHGKIDVTLVGFSQLLPANDHQPLPAAIQTLATLTQDPPDPADDTPDPEENLMIPAGYTYLGQFIDHDLTFDTTSTLNLHDHIQYTDARTPRFDLDNLYGGGSDAMHTCMSRMACILLQTNWTYLEPPTNAPLSAIQEMMKTASSAICRWPSSVFNIGSDEPCFLDTGISIDVSLASQINQCCRTRHSVNPVIQEEATLAMERFRKT